MCHYNIKVSKELATQLSITAMDKNMSIEELIEEILNKYFVPMHTIDQEEMAKGYEEMGEINLELSK